MKQTELEKAAEALKDEINEYEKRLIWGENWREVFDNINKEMNMEKLTAIAFGQWLCDHWESCNTVWNENGDSVPVDPFWRQPFFHGMKLCYRNATTEELYEEFIKSHNNV